MKKNLKFYVDKEDTMLPFLLTHINGVSRNNVKGMLKRGQIAVDGSVCKDYARILHPDQQIEVLLNLPVPGSELEFPVIYEDDELIVIDKPAGMLAIATDRERKNTAYHAVTDYIKTRSRSERVFVVHRLDRETSGVMLLAKNERIKYAMQENWDSLAVHRGYIAVVEGTVTPQEGTVISWLKQTKTLLVYSSKKSGDGKKAITNYKVLETAGAYTLLGISLDTGRKNQIRVHMHDIGNPIAGDKKYGAQTNPISRLCLHASDLTIKHPLTQKEMRFESKIPAAFTRLLRVNNE